MKLKEIFKSRFIVSTVIIIIGVIVMGVGTLIGNKANTTKTEPETFDIKGIVKSKANNNIYVESTDANSIVENAVIYKKAETKVKNINDDIEKSTTFEAIQIGDKVTVTFTGEMRESYPVQADAKEITITGYENVTFDKQVGTIQGITKNGEYGTIHIKEANYEAYVTITKDTLITKAPLSRTFTFDELKVGDKVEVTVPEVITMIYPAQYTTTGVDIIE